MPKIKLKPVKRAELKPGLNVVVNTLSDTYIYTVGEVSTNGLVASLTYRTGQHVASGGCMDISGLSHPSQDQYKHAFDSVVQAYGLGYSYSGGGVVRGQKVPYHFMLDAPSGKLFNGTLIHCDGSIQGQEGTTKTDWAEAYGLLLGIVSEGFTGCDDGQCEYCHP